MLSYIVVATLYKTRNKSELIAVSLCEVYTNYDQLAVTFHWCDENKI